MPTRRVVSFVVAIVTLVASGMLALVLAAPITKAHAATAPKVTAWLPYWDQSRALQSFLDNADLYAYASPFWYEMSPSATITKYPGAEDATVLSGIRGKGVKVIPTITNNFDPTRVTTMLASDSSRAAHIQLLVNLVQSMGYDGIDVDYESMAATDRSNFSAFITSLAAAMHANGKLLTVVVHAKTSEPGTWSGPQAEDYAAIGAVADRVRIMTYDYSWSTSPAGPIAPLSWVTDVAAFAASVISPAKIELGMNLYGYDWVGSQGEGIMHDVAASRLATYGATRVWDSTYAEPHFSYTANGTAHTVWYGDAQSVAARLAIVDKYALAGAAFWHLGGEDPDVWTTIRNHYSAATPTPSPTPTADTTAPTVPTGVTAAVGVHRIKVSWHASTDTGGSGLAGYEVYRATVSGGTWTKLTATTSLSFTNTGLTKRHRYWYFVRAYDHAGNRSGNSTVVSAVSK